MEAVARPQPGGEYAGRDLEAMDFAERYHRWILSEFRPFVRGEVAEVGAGSGAFSRMLLELPEVRRLAAVEPSGRMHALLEQRIAGDPRAEAHRAFFAEVAPRSALDAILYVNVLEHVEDDAGELAVAAAALRPGGHLCVFVPALRWLYSPFDAAIGHHRRYHRGELVEKVRAAGLSVVRCRYFDAAGILPWLVAFRLLRRTLGGGQVRLYDRLVVPLAAPLERLVAPPLGKNLLLVARKPAP
jgi:SAM-dependent methyltransferase